MKKKGQIITITVSDGFSGKAKIIKNRLFKWLIEIVDVSMCYPQQVQLQPGTRMWISYQDLYKEKRRKVKRNKRQLENELPF